MPGSNQGGAPLFSPHRYKLLQHRRHPSVTYIKAMRTVDYGDNNAARWDDGLCTTVRMGDVAACHVSLLCAAVTLERIIVLMLGATNRNDLDAALTPF